MGMAYFEAHSPEELAPRGRAAGRAAADRRSRRRRAPSPSCSPPATPASCCTRRSATASRPTSTASRPANYSGRIGQLVASELCTVVDDGTIEDSRGSINVDDEGNLPGYNVLIENGILQAYLQDRISADAMGTRPSGNGRRQSFKHYPMPRMTNTYMLAGQSAPEEIIALREQGHLLRRLLRRAGEHQQRRLRLQRHRGLHDRGRQHHRAHPQREPDRQRPRRAHQGYAPSATTSRSATGAGPAARTASPCRSASASRRSWSPA